jgi:hypothetical protein
MCSPCHIRTSKFSSNLIVYLLFLFFAVPKKKKESLWNIFFLITQPFLYLEGALKLISQEQLKTQQPKYSKFNINFEVQRKFLRIEYDMESTLFHFGLKPFTSISVLVSQCQDVRISKSLLGLHKGFGSVVRMP